MLTRNSTSIIEFYAFYAILHKWYGPTFHHMPPAIMCGMDTCSCIFTLLL